MGNTYVITQVPGRVMKELLENGISAWPNFDGRWPIISGCKFKFDPEQPPGSRIVEDSFMTDQDTPVDNDKMYSLAIDTFLSHGKDGFHAMLDDSVVKCKDYENLPYVSDCIKNCLSLFRKPTAELETLTGRKSAILQTYLKAFDTSLDNRDPESGYIKIEVQAKDRIINVGTAIEHKD